MNMETMNMETMNNYWLVFSIILIIAIGYFIYGFGMLLFDIWMRRKCKVVVEATIESFYTKSVFFAWDPRKKHFIPIYLFKFNGRKYKVESRIFGDKMKSTTEIGSHVLLRVNQKNPQEICLAKNIRIWYEVGITVISCVVSILMIWGLSICDWPSDRNREPEMRIAKEARDIRLENQLTSLVQNGEVSGSLMVATDKNVIFASGSTLIDKEGNIVSPYSVYEIASVTKVFTATAILQLVDAGKMNLEDTVDYYLPEYKRGADITIYDLLHMCSGLPDYYNDSAKFWGKAYTPDSMAKAIGAGKLNADKIIEKLNEVQLMFEPGKQMEYSNTNYFLLAKIVEQVSGQTYEEYLRENIFEPVGMNHSGWCEFDTLTCLPEGGIRYLRIYKDMELGIGGICSNTEDLLQFDQALVDGKILSDNALEMMFEMNKGYGCGWFSEESQYCYFENAWESNQGKVAFHAGSSVEGYRSMNAIMELDGERIYIVAMNLDKKDLSSAVMKACQEYFKKNN